MTADTTIVFSPDVSVLNEVVHLPALRFRNPKTSAAFRSSHGTSPANATVAYVAQLNAWLRSELPHHKLYLLIGSSAWQPDSRVVRHYKLCGALRANDVLVPSLTEWVVEAHRQLKFFGFADLTNFPDDLTEKALVSEPCAYLDAARTLEQADLPATGWSGRLSEDVDLIKHIAGKDGVLIKAVGAFDDQERGALLIGKFDTLRKLAKGVGT
ncbi:MAG: hypothetical protein KKC79_15355 [Gammaproteobacteria bacterium]|nr:hypothetical protein [Gammaproteobacteria bacterium]MBU1441685.1 hypothetical protein [Gammaproteobacteria bacterium]MBU2289291.1 hypothetical protein [Gammaproteobacteria bacterium]MBU2410012.1 hypothetical protein [Gammaproteobacteria bacterium]